MPDVTAAIDALLADGASFLESRLGLPAMLELAIAHGNQEATIAHLTQLLEKSDRRAATAELALMSLVKREQTTADVFAFDGDADDGMYFATAVSL